MIFQLLKLEWRLSRGSLAVLMKLGFFALLLTILFYIALAQGMGEAARYATQVVWIILVMGGILQCNRSFDSERNGNVLDGLRMIPGAISALYIAKWVANLVTLWILLGLLSVMIMIFFNLAADQLNAAFFIPAALGLVGLTAIGTLFSGMVRMHRARDMVLPVLLIPIILPLALMVSRWYAAISIGEGMWDVAWGHLVVATDILFFASAWLLFPSVVKD
ncbi:MAG: hypothetical protein COV45_09405 [Deltaproteobacteria bacterium CG11_big_fil_rev_8_21_14_0_20_47_16]|nr:MAG: hypothetical protein COV45_09405 [Deltaproteobacteria bacterium CG11_big_fil_rev_8_21_14_0_20_47_16]